MAVVTDSVVRYTPEQAQAVVDRLRQIGNEAFERQVFGHRYMQELMAGTLPLAKVKGFFLNWYRFAVEINTVKSDAYNHFLGFLERHPDCYDKEARRMLLAGASPFEFEGLTYVSDIEDSKALTATAAPFPHVAAPTPIDTIFGSAVDATMLPGGYAYVRIKFELPTLRDGLHSGGLRSVIARLVDMGTDREMEARFQNRGSRLALAKLAEEARKSRAAAEILSHKPGAKGG